MGSYGFPADKSKFQLRTMTRRIIIYFHGNWAAGFCIFFPKSSSRNSAKYAFHYTFNTTQYAKKKNKKRRNKVGTFTTIFTVGHPPRLTGHNLSGATKQKSFARIIARYIFLDEVGN